MNKFILFFITTSLISSFTNFSRASGYDHLFIENLAKETVENAFESNEDKKISIHVSRLDSRIQLKQCDQSLVANIPENHNSRNVNVKISCEGSMPWSIYLPVKVRSQVPAIIATSNISKGSILTHDNTALIYINENKVRGERITRSEDIIGAKAKRTISARKSITRRNICVVCKGDNVTIVAKSSTFSIKAEGLSLSSGHLGESIKIKNSRSGKLLTAKVSGLNKVQINL